MNAIGFGWYEFGVRVGQLIELLAPANPRRDRIGDPNDAVLDDPAFGRAALIAARGAAGTLAGCPLQVRREIDRGLAAAEHALDLIESRGRLYDDDRRALLTALDNIGRAARSAARPSGVRDAYELGLRVPALRGRRADEPGGPRLDWPRPSSAEDGDDVDEDDEVLPAARPIGDAERPYPLVWREPLYVERLLACCRVTEADVMPVPPEWSPEVLTGRGDWTGRLGDDFGNAWLRVEEGLAAIGGRLASPLSVDRQAGTATFRGETYTDLSADAVAALDVLLRHPGERLKFAEIVEKSGRAEFDDSNPTRWKRRLPDPLRDLIDSNTNGYRLRLSEEL